MTRSIWLSQYDPVKITQSIWLSQRKKRILIYVVFNYFSVFVGLSRRWWKKMQQISSNVGQLEQNNWTCQSRGRSPTRTGDQVHSSKHLMISKRSVFLFSVLPWERSVAFSFPIMEEPLVKIPFWSYLPYSLLAPFFGEWYEVYLPLANLIRQLPVTY